MRGSMVKKPHGVGGAKSQREGDAGDWEMNPGDFAFRVRGGRQRLLRAPAVRVGFFWLRGIAGSSAPRAVPSIRALRGWRAAIAGLRAPPPRRSPQAPAAPGSPPATGLGMGEAGGGTLTLG